MTNATEHQSWIFRFHRRTARVALTLVAMLVLGIVTTQSAKAQSYEVLYSFIGGADGAYPEAGLTLDAAGNLYGTTDGGGAANSGTVFKLDTTGTETVLYAFTGGADGKSPLAPLVLDPSGNLYGTTYDGGKPFACFYDNDSCGVVFKLDTAGTETVLYTFRGETDGRYPSTGVLRDPAGHLYGTTQDGGSEYGCARQSCGVVFKLKP